MNRADSDYRALCRDWERINHARQKERSQDGTAERPVLPREAPKPNSSETVAATGLETDPGCKTEPSNG